MKEKDVSPGMERHPFRDLLSDVYYYSDFILLLICLPVMILQPAVVPVQDFEVIIGTAAGLLTIYLTVKCLIKYKSPFIKVIAFFILAYIVIILLG